MAITDGEALMDDAAAVIGGGDDGADAPQIDPVRILHPHTLVNNGIDVSRRVCDRRRCSS